MKERYIPRILLRRIFSSLILLLLIISVLFWVLRIAPGDPTQKYISPELSPELKEKVESSFGLDRPLIEQYYHFIINFFKGDLGVSYDYNLPVLTVISQFLPFTILFAFICFTVQFASALVLSLYTTMLKNKLISKFIDISMLLLYAVPVFVLGVILLFIFSVNLDLFPLSGLRSFDHDSLSFSGKLFDYISHLFLPVLALSLVGIPMFYKYLKDNLRDVTGRIFITNLRANGVSEREILYKHIIPNAIKPLISVAGIELGLLLSGALITEVIFGLPGFGRLTVTSIFSRDYPLIIGSAFVSGILIILSNFLADIVKVLIDKRLLMNQLS